MSVTLPEGYQARPAQMDDLENVVRLCNEWSRHIIGMEKFELEDSRHDWLTIGFNMETDTRIVLTPEGRTVGYYDVWDLFDPHVLVFFWGRVHPDFQEEGVESYLLEWAEERARQAIPKAPPEARVVMQCSTLSIDEQAQAHFRQAGLTCVRHALRMVIELDNYPPEPHWPEGVSVTSMVPGGDLRSVYQAYREAFKDHWGQVERPFEEEFEHWKHQIDSNPDFDPALFFLAMVGEEIAGVSLCWPKTYDDPEMGWVSTLAVQRSWRRRGLGIALLQHSFRELYQRGLRKVGLGVDAQSLTGATRLFEKAGMHSDPARQFSIYEKELRPGIDLRTKN